MYETELVQFYLRSINCLQ